MCSADPRELEKKFVTVNLLLLAGAGALGTLARFALHGAVQRAAGGEFPYGTLAVNAAGSLAFGIIWSLAQERLAISEQTRTLLLVGFMGAFTTFSTFAFETGQFLRSSQWLMAGANILASNALAIGLFLAGVALGRLL